MVQLKNMYYFCAVYNCLQFANSEQSDMNN